MINSNRNKGNLGMEKDIILSDSLIGGRRIGKLNPSSPISAYPPISKPYSISPHVFSLSRLPFVWSVKLDTPPSVVTDGAQLPFLHFYVIHHELHHEVWTFRSMCIFFFIFLVLFWFFILLSKQRWKIW